MPARMETPMSNAGYGNHDEPPPASKGANAALPGESLPGSADAAPRPAAEPAVTVKPKEGAGPSGPQGDEVDPGVG